jgi:hypothetical protein
MAARTCKASLAIVETAHSSLAALSHLQVARRVGPEEFNERITPHYSLNALKSANPLHQLPCPARKCAIQLYNSGFHLAFL